METKAGEARIAIDPLNGTTWLTIAVEDSIGVRKFLSEAKDKPLRLTLKRWQEKRSLSANSYSWLLLNKLSEKLAMPAEEIYRNLIPDVGGNSAVMTVDVGDVKFVKERWSERGLGWIVDVIGSSGPGKVDLMLYEGSSHYDKPTMARLIDLIIEECKAQDIEYLPPDKLAAMLEDWNAKQTDKGPGD